MDPTHPRPFDTLSGISLAVKHPTTRTSVRIVPGFGESYQGGPGAETKSMKF